MASLADPSVRAPEPQHAAMVVIGSFGMASLAFCVAAELSRVRSFTLQTIATGEAECVYPYSPSLWYCVAATLALLLAQASALLLGSFAWCPGRNRNALSSTRASVPIVLVAELAFSATAMATILTAAVRNESLPLYPLNSSPENPQCVLLDEGLFLTAAILSVFATILIEAYYILSMRALRETWLDAYSSGSIEGLQMLSQGTSTVRVATAPKEDFYTDEDILGDIDFNGAPHRGHDRNQGRGPPWHHLAASWPPAGVAQQLTSQEDLSCARYTSVCNP